MSSCMKPRQTKGRRRCCRIAACYLPKILAAISMISCSVIGSSSLNYRQLEPLALPNPNSLNFPQPHDQKRRRQGHESRTKGTQHRDLFRQIRSPVADASGKGWTHYRRFSCCNGNSRENALPLGVWNTSTTSRYLSHSCRSPWREGTDALAGRVKGAGEVPIKSA